MTLALELLAILILLRKAGSVIGLALADGSRNHGDRLDLVEVTDNPDTLGARSPESVCLCFFL